MVRTRPILPEGHGQVVERPDFAEWTTLLEHNRRAAAGWDFEFAGMNATSMRDVARRDLLGVGAEFSARMGVDLAVTGSSADPIVATGHQPDLYHPGVWVKAFLLERLSRESGATGVDVVVDTDGFDTVAVTAPCMRPSVRRCNQYLAVGAGNRSYAQSPVPSQKDVDDFCSSTDSMLASLPAPAVRRHFGSFCEALKDARPAARNLAEFLTIARRRYEASAATGYLEAPLTALAHTESFLRFVVGLCLDSNRFVSVYNAELDAYRELTKTRSAAQPFPNLASREGARELPLWHLGDGRREPLWVEAGDAGDVRLVSGGQTLVRLPADPEDALAALVGSGAAIAPKALSLTLFVRMFACDLFIHGVGGGRYDQVTDGVIRRYFGVEPPAFVVGSMTMYLPIGARIVTAEDVAAAKERLNRLEHNPDALLGEIDFDSAEEEQRTRELAAEKRALVVAISSPDADRKTLGLRIREVNRGLSEVLEPLREVYVSHLAELEEQFKESEILTDRTYPYCFWEPGEIADKVW